VEVEEKTRGGILIPDTAKEKPVEGEVLAVARATRRGRFIRSKRRSGIAYCSANGPAPM
jgi:co-chaperonin GroES (HSP10)